MSLYVRNFEWGTKYPNFKKSEFKCPKYCKGYGSGIATSLLDVLQNLRNIYGDLRVTSGYRCKSYNSSLSGSSSNSYHLRGQACDFYFGSGILKNESVRIDIVNKIKRMSNVHYSYCNVNGNHQNMGSAIHVDTYLVDTDVMELQRILNGCYNSHLAVDGSCGELTKTTIKKNYLYRGKNAPIHVTWLQQQLKWRGYDIGKSGIDGSFGNDTRNALMKYQSYHKLKVDGYCGLETTLYLLFKD